MGSGKFLDLPDFQPRRHGNQQGPPDGQQALQGSQAVRHHVGLDCQENPVTLGGDGFVVPVGNPQLLGQGLGLAGAVRDENVLGFLA